MSVSIPHQILHQYWGHADFRALQFDIINAVLAGSDTLALLPTGGGKSICFQVPALCMEGICIVVSPLIALMKDQVENLRSRNISAAALYSGMSSQEIEGILNSAVNGGFKFLYLSPERLQSEHTQDKISEMKVCLLAVDEAHCISQWGYDFRPEYLLIATIRNLTKQAPVLALTASATQAVVADIQDKLLFKKPLVFRKSFERKNLQYVVRTTDDKYNKLLEICTKTEGSGLVYVNNRRLTQEIAIWLKQNNISSYHYHAGLTGKDRSRIQEEWIKNKTRVIVCTNAFGMGIDKPDVRFVVHYQMSPSLEAYYQEAGRAGRDGNRAYCVVLHHAADETNARKLLELKYVPKTEVKRIYEMLCNYLKVPLEGGMDIAFEFDLRSFCKALSLKPVVVASALKVLEQNMLLMATPPLFTPSKLQITTDAATLYNYQSKNKNHDAILKSIIRSYGGIFDYFANINETEIAARTPNSTPAAVVECLQHLNTLQLVAYQPQNDKPKICFLSPRLPVRSVEINEEMQLLLKAREIEKLTKAFQYAHQTTRCRSQEILHYFDEPKALPCGVCDVCLEFFRNTISASKFKEIHLEIKELIRNSPITAETLLDTLIFPRHETTLVLKYLITHELIKISKQNTLFEN